MTVNDRLAGAEAESTHVVGEPVASVDAKGAIKRSIHYLLIEEMGAELAVGDDDAALRRRLERKLAGLLEQETAPLSDADTQEIIGDVLDGLVGYGPIDALLDDPTVTEVMVNGPGEIYVERSGKMYLTDRCFVDEAHLTRVIDKIVAGTGAVVSQDSPMVDVRLPNGSRANVVVAPLAINGPLLTVRKYTDDPFTAEDLIAFGTMTERVAEFIAACVRGRLNVVISGGTRSGKTTLLNVASSYIPGDERVVTVEDAAELRLRQEHVVRLESRPAGVGGLGEVTLRDVVSNSLRMRPDRIVVGEVRGSEVVEMLQAMNTGHDGTLFSVHADSPREALRRLETMVLMGGVEYPSRAILAQLSSALDVIIHMARLRDGTRRVVQVSEVLDAEDKGVALRDIFSFDFSAGPDEDGRFRGRVHATGHAPSFVRKLESMGVTFSLDAFEEETPGR